MRGHRFLISVLCAIGFVISSPKPASAETKAETKEWTFLVFLNGNNNLDRFGSEDINEMEKVGSTDQVNVVVQWASLANKKTQRLLVQKDTDATKVTSPILQDLGKADMGDYRTLIEFVRWGVQNYPAKKYFINVWDHGGGWHFQTLKDDFSIKDISWDDTTGHFMTTEQLGVALAESAKIMGHKVDVYGSDACLMAMAEVAGEMQSSVQMFVGAQEVEPGDGWPYDDFLKAWNAKASASSADVAKALVQTFLASYSKGSQGDEEVTLSALNLDLLADFSAALKKLSAEMMKADTGQRDKITASLRATQNFTESDYGDLVDFMVKVKGQKLGAGLDSAIAGVAASLQNLIVANGVSPEYGRASGLSVWMPDSLSSYNTYADRYKGLGFNKASDWGAALRYVLQGT